MQVDSNAELRDRIDDLRRRRSAVILAHNYQLGEVQEIADFVGDSLDLSRRAAATSAEVIVFCGVHFMAETAAILSPDKVVLLPALEAGCPMAKIMKMTTLEKVLWALQEMEQRIEVPPDVRSRAETAVRRMIETVN